MTSNIGADMIKKAGLGFNIPRGADKADQQDYEDMKKTLTDSLRRAFRPEFLNRVDSTIIFRSLTKAEITDIVDILMDDVKERVVEHDLVLELSQAGKEHLADAGYDPEYGARPLRRVIQNQIEDILSDGLLSGAFTPGGTIYIDASEGSLTFEQREREVPEEDPAPA
jgi:ATP-dependent Clp protease ATP-binding subunit ClpC